MKSYQQGSAHLILLIVIFVVIVAGVGVVAYNQFQKTNAPAQQAKQDTEKTPEPACKKDETETAQNGIFCSEDIGIKFPVSAQFKGKFVKAANYEVFEGPMDQPPGTSAGTSETVFEGKIEAPEYQQVINLTIAKEPLRSSYTGLSHLLRNTYFNKDNGSLNLINGPSFNYDPATGKTTPVGEYSVGDAVPSSQIDNTEFYRGNDGDAGVVSTEYMAVIKNKIVKIMLRSQQNPSASENPNFKNLFSEFDTNIKALQVL